MPGVAAERLQATLAAKVAGDGAIDGDLSLRAGAVRATGGSHADGGSRAAGGSRVAARDAALDVHAEALRVDPARPLATRGVVTASVRAASVELVEARLRAAADGLAGSVRAHLDGKPPYSVDAELPMARLRVVSDGRTLVDDRARLALRVHDLRPDLAVPRRSRAVVHAEVGLGALVATVDADKLADAVDFKLRADAPSLALLRRLMPEGAGARAPWSHMSLALASDGRLEHLAAPSLREHTTLALGHPAFAAPGGRVAADRLELTASSNGTLDKADATLALRTRALVVGSARQGDAGLDVSARFDLRAPMAHLVVTSRGDHGPALSARAELGFDRARRAVTYDLDAKAARLATLAPLVHGGLGGFDFAALAVAFTGKGSIAGLVHDVDAHGRPGIVADPLRTLAVDGTLNLAVDGLDWSREDREVAVPHARWHAVLATDGARRLVHGTLTLDELTLDAGDHSSSSRTCATTSTARSPATCAPASAGSTTAWSSARSPRIWSPATGSATSPSISRPNATATAWSTSPTSRSATASPAPR